MEQNNYDLAIIGGGAAGFTAAVYACRNNKKVVVFEGHAIGGQISESPLVENYPSIMEISGQDFSDNIMNQAIHNGAVVEFENIASLEHNGEHAVLTTELGNVFQSKAVILAVGCEPRRIGFENEKHWIGKGLGYCAVCDGNFYKNKDVAVIGGGDTALQEAIYLSNICKSVTLVHRREEFRASEVLVQRAKSRANIKYALNAVALRPVGEEKIQGVVLKSTVDGSESELAVDAVFVAIGRIPQTKLFAKYLNLDEQGFILAGEDCKTQHKWLFVAGDCRQKSLRQLTTAVSDGSVAGIAASEFIEE